MPVRVPFRFCERLRLVNLGLCYDPAVKLIIRPRIPDPDHNHMLFVVRGAMIDVIKAVSSAGLRVEAVTETA